MEEKSNCVYMLRCNDDSLYTGWTNDLKNRIKAHSAGRGAKYTKARLPVKLVYREACTTKSAAMKREYAIKHLTKEQKLELIGSCERAASGEVRA
ncbi:GIY-YIG nuclease family protein [Hydrogenoanaerobacterium sp.]|uniref:GIY-YIG nuclease family protein n=1 Tax=Hydrogenoanaerobacterium sp. TaxID=2953763 RepID=UPI0028A00751|nr:GIY-YIG nuclease family protein [Hydrogenoanaerobacterium sp.]